MKWKRQYPYSYCIQPLALVQLNNYLHAHQKKRLLYAIVAPDALWITKIGVVRVKLIVPQQAVSRTRAYVNACKQKHTFTNQSHTFTNRSHTYSCIISLGYKNILKHQKCDAYMILNSPDLQLYLVLGGDNQSHCQLEFFDNLSPTWTRMLGRYLAAYHPRILK